MAKQKGTGKDWTLYEDDLAGFYGCYSNTLVKPYHKHHNNKREEN